MKPLDARAVTSLVCAWYPPPVRPSSPLAMIDARSLALLCMLGWAVAVPTSQKDEINIACPDQDENSTVVTIANPDNCSTFYECDNGVAKLLACSPDTYFSSKEHVCTFKKDSDCPTFADLMSLTLDDDGGDGDDAVNFTCPDEPDNKTSTYYPNLRNCSTFYECSNGRPVLLGCPRKMFFNAKLCVCTLPKKSGCTQPDDDGDGDDEDEGLAAFAEEVFEMSDDDWFELREHLERVYSGKCHKS